MTVGRRFSPTFPLGFLFLFCAFGLSCNACARDAQPRLPEIAVAELPKEAQETLALIKRGGPFRHPKDGTVFGNFERQLPAREHGYYREYTVPTPGAKDRGARRIVAGRGTSDDAQATGAYYYTDDHYRSFRRIRE